MTSELAVRRRHASLGVAAVIGCVALVWASGAPDRVPFLWLGVLLVLRMVPEIIWPYAWAAQLEQQPWSLPILLAVGMAGIAVVDGAGMRRAARVTAVGAVLGTAAVIVGRRSRGRHDGG